MHGPVLAQLAVLARAVERIDDPHALLREALAAIDRLLGEDPVGGVAPAHEPLDVAVRGLVADVGEHRIAPTARRAQREHARSGRARRVDGELDVGADGGGQLGEVHCA